MILEKKWRGLNKWIEWLASSIVINLQCIDNGVNIKLVFGIWLFL